MKIEIKDLATFDDSDYAVLRRLSLPGGWIRFNLYHLGGGEGEEAKKARKYKGVFAFLSEGDKVVGWSGIMHTDLSKGTLMSYISRNYRGRRLANKTALAALKASKVRTVRFQRVMRGHPRKFDNRMWVELARKDLLRTWMKRNG